MGSAAEDALLAAADHHRLADLRRITSADDLNADGNHVQEQQQQQQPVNEEQFISDADEFVEWSAIEVFAFADGPIGMTFSHEREVFPTMFSPSSLSSVLLFPGGINCDRGVRCSSRRRNNCR